MSYVFTELASSGAPQVYFVGESIKNLKAELARGAKLKCSERGLKGAAIGCYVKSFRRTYMLLVQWTCELAIGIMRTFLCSVQHIIVSDSQMRKSKSKKNASQKHHHSDRLLSFWVDLFNNQHYSFALLILKDLPPEHRVLHQHSMLF
ncbi:hypothetical protein L6164_034352 [Bauhinia variegata]|uniref:Uncharacterized protein n=1 Tax=Bauhinia variegata TaxID=167791 RepID=A0ACB9KVB7_BAUVA|nr:hypothetical protein L6164_034352 [Bauhinia variegata]